MATPAYVLDSCSLIHVERSSDLRKLPPADVRTYIPDRVAREVNKPGTRLATWLRSNHKLVTHFINDEGKRYLELMRDGLDDGEAAALAIAVERRAIVVTDDGAAQVVAGKLQVRCLNTRAYLIEAIPTQGRLIG